MIIIGLQFTEEQIEIVNGMNILEYARDAGFPIKRFSPNTYKIEGYGGLYIHADGHKWNWFSQHKGGGIIQFVMEMQNLSWRETVEQLLGSDYESIPYMPLTKNNKRGEMVLPEKNIINKHVIDYLTKVRKIDKETVNRFLKLGTLYENTYKSCVFVGHDEYNHAKYASVRSTNITGKCIRMDVKNSDKRYCFHLKGSNNILNIYEAPIDLISYLSLLKLHNVMDFENHMLALGGVSTLALTCYLKLNPQIDTIMLCLDNDTAGHFACQSIKNELREKNLMFIRHCPKTKDFNEDLKVLVNTLNKTEQYEEVVNKITEYKQEGIEIG